MSLGVSAAIPECGTLAGCSLGDKRRKIGEKEDGRDQIAEIVRRYGRFVEEAAEGTRLG